MYKNHKTYQRQMLIRSILNKSVVVFVVLSAVVAIGSAIYMQVLYATGEISPQDYARLRGQPPTVIIVNPQ